MWAKRMDLRCSLRQWLARPEAIAQFDRLRRFDSAFSRFSRLEDLRQYAEADGRSDPEPDLRDEVLRALVAIAQGSAPERGTANALLWLAFWPSLEATKRWGIMLLGDPDEVEGIVFEKFAVVINRLRLEGVTRVGATVALNTTRLVAKVLRLRLRARREIPAGKDLEETAVVDPGALAYELWHKLFAVVGDDAALVVRVVVEGYTHVELARREGVHPESMRRRFQRLLGRLRSRFFQENDDGGVGFFLPGARMEGEGDESSREVTDGQPEDRRQRRGAEIPRWVLEAAGTVPPVRARADHSDRGIQGRRSGGDDRRSPASGRVQAGYQVPGGRVSGGGSMSAAKTLSVVVLVPDPDPARTVEAAEIVRYCDRCRRWGQNGSTHICGENWSEHLAVVLQEQGRAA